MPGAPAASGRPAPAQVRSHEQVPPARPGQARGGRAGSPSAAAAPRPFAAGASQAQRPVPGQPLAAPGARVPASRLERAAEAQADEAAPRTPVRAAKAEAAEARAAAAPSLAPAAPLVFAQLVPGEGAAPLHAAAARAPAGPTPMPASLAQAAEEDASLRLAVLPHAANLRLTTAGADDLSLHLRVRGGVANLTVSGPAGQAVEARSDDLRAALAGQGLSLGTIERVPAAPAAPQAAPTHTSGRQGDDAQRGRHDEPRGRPEPAEERTGAYASLARGLH